MKPRTRRIALLVLVVALASLLLIRRGFSWHEQEHAQVTRLSQRLLVDSDLPRFFVEGIPGQATHCAIDPDLFKHPKLEHLYNAEAPEHYLDLEYFQGKPLPERRYDYLALCAEMGVNPRHAGTLPYAIAEWTERLTQAFVEYRADPTNEHVRRKCLVYAGLLAHYAGDLHQPLHTTVHFDGRVDQPGEKSPRTGIHERVDGLFRRMEVDPAVVLADREPAPFDDLWAGIMAHFNRSHALVDRVYELEDRLGEPEQPISDPEVRAFAIDRLGASTTFLASLYLTAWETSADLELPDWLDRSALEKGEAAE